MEGSLSMSFLLTPGSVVIGFKRKRRKFVHVFPLNPGQRDDRLQKKWEKAFSGSVWQ